jgi:hypothetical protein
MKKRGSLPLFAVGTLTVSVICTLLADGGWQIWVPVLPALAVVGVLARRIG